MTLRRTARFALGIALMILLGVLLPPFVSIARYRARVRGALSSAIGRDVSIGSVSLQLVPQPGLTMQNVIVADDPRFGAEPMLRADEVVATLRLTSMWRGRFEIGSLSLKEPSLNLVRSADGHWNIESLLQRAAEIPTAPTSKPRPESRSRFPYIEASSGRINFKFGQEKKAWALTDADFALWLASEDEWRTRLTAKPVRTDVNVSDTGTIRVTGSIQRTAHIDASKFKFRASLQGAQLGELSTLIYGHDRGWRGGTSATIDVGGTASQVAMALTASVDQFRRYDITPPDSLRLEVRCLAQYRALEQQLSGIDCHMPADQGELIARGSIGQLLDQPRYDVDLSARDVPMSYAIAFAKRAKKDLPADLSAGGSFSAAVTARSAEGNAVVWDGGGSTRDFTLQSSVLEEALPLGKVEFAMQPEIVPASGRVAKPSTLPVVATYRVTVPSFPLPLGSTVPATAQAIFGRDGYAVDVSGSAAISRLVQVAHAFGIPAPAIPVQGAATRMALRIAGEWRGFQQPLVTGSSDLQNVRVNLNGVARPVQVASASVVLLPQQVAVQNLVAAVGPVGFTGWIRQSRGCPSPAPCNAEFALRAGALSLDDVNRLLNPRLQAEPWYRRLAGGEAPPSLFARLHADGQISVARLAVKNVILQNVGGTLHLAPGKVQIASASATLFGGTAHGDVQADFTGSGPIYSGTGLLQRVTLAQVSTAMRDNWATGTADASYRFTATGRTFDELVHSAAATLDFTWKDGLLRHLALANAHGTRMDSGALRISNFHGRAALRGGVLTISDAQMQTPSGTYAVSGTASSARELALTFTLRGEQQYTVGGTLASPRVEAVSLAPRANAAR